MQGYLWARREGEDISKEYKEYLKCFIFFKRKEERKGGRPKAKTTARLDLLNLSIWHAFFFYI